MLCLHCYITIVAKMLQMHAQMSHLWNTQLQQWTLLSPYTFRVKFWLEFSIHTDILSPYKFQFKSLTWLQYAEICEQMSQNVKKNVNKMLTNVMFTYI